ncbi:aminoacyl-tRNA hydrolase [Cellulomonas fengjieae]|uniref:Peptidyl-tRNA hydrolase n=1 Tax=Cellulomonas fengjieae TaxID=2819978 RepID=A0ABS3SLD9_9CELL|nr:aminoacyl-tRNA hydrolase [Cellulomonas fengjieae]MBO3086553.1 aminoacyl-tRNA hydrolase [Cellulomonas fengjieae]MBO3100549.1 aminoacyl-tRNA hydrolase [Cellulomonas fengjieae]QVI66591.1 aminoacyl-tRNA hydrolase [Cellulomonas fengjieae]
MSDGPWLVVGLGNPGPQYAGNRHNVGQMVLDELARRTGVTFGARASGLLSRRPQAAVAEARLGVLPGGAPGPRVVLAKPTTYMNVSGGPVAALAKYYDVPLERTVLVHDELDIPFADVRLKRGGGEGGHNGLRDTSKALGSKDYLRVRVGVGRPPGRMDPADYVLRDFAKSELKDLPWLVDAAADAVELLITQGLEAAQLKFHTKA